MPRSRKRHHSRSRSKSRSRSHSCDRSHEKLKKLNSHEKDGKRRRLDEIIDSPNHQKSLSSDGSETMSNQRFEDVEVSSSTCPQDADVSLVESESHNENEKTNSDCEADSVEIEMVYDKIEKLTTPKKPLTPKQLQKKIESEKKKQQKQKEKEEREKQRQDEKAKLLAEKQKAKEQKEAEKQKILEEKQKQLELKQKEKELKEEQKRKEKEDKEQKRKEKEEQEAAKRKEKEEEKLKKLEEKNKEKQKEEEKKQKTAAIFKNFFKKTDAEEKEMKIEKVNFYFMPFEVKSDMRLPPVRRRLLSDDKRQLEFLIENQNENISYLKELKSGELQPGKSTKTWPYEESEEVTIVEDDRVLGEKICEDTPIVHKVKAKFLFFHENRRPAYFGTWRKLSKFVKPRRPFAADTTYFNYDEDSDDDWEEEEQGESLDVSGDEEEKDTEHEEEYEVDNEFFVPHGHLSDDEVDDEENARLSPESLKQKLKLLKDEFEEDMKSKTKKLKPRSVGVIWLNTQGDNVDEAIYRYLQSFAMIVDCPKEIRSRSEIFASPIEKRKLKPVVELPIDHIPHFLKIIHGNVNKKKTVIEEFLTFMANNGFTVEVSKANLSKILKHSATYKRCSENGPLKNKFGWFVNDDVKQKYNVQLELSKTKI